MAPWVAGRLGLDSGCLMGTASFMKRSRAMASAWGAQAPMADVAAVVPLSRYPGDWPAGAAAVATLVQLFVCFGNIGYFDENALVELTQCALLLSATVLFCVAARKTADRLTLVRLLALAVFSLTVLFREIEVEGTPFGPYLEFTRRYELKYVFLGVLWLSLLLLSRGRLKESVVTMLRWLVTHPGKFLLAGIIFYLLGDAAEKHLFVSDADLSRMIEESLETLGTLSIFLSAYGALRRQLIFSAILPRKP